MPFSTAFTLRGQSSSLVCFVLFFGLMSLALGVGELHALQLNSGSSQAPVSSGNIPSHKIVVSGQTANNILNDLPKDTRYGTANDPPSAPPITPPNAPAITPPSVPPSDPHPTSNLTDQHRPSPRNPLGFSMFNGRNHPELKWQTAETEHFLIHYPERIAGIEVQAAPIAEATYQALSANLDVTFDFKIRIYLSDEDEIVNGFAVPFRDAYTNIWVHLNDVAESWSSREKWLRTVLAHELAHIFHYEAVKSNLAFPGTLLTAPGLPAPWTEGIAQYQTEPWHALRGDALLRTSFYDGRPDFRDGTSIRNRGLMYASGNAQLRYFASVYGDSLLAQILAYRKDILGLVEVHDFEEGFEEVTGKTFPEFEDEWRRHMSIYYFTLAGQMERRDSLNSETVPLPGLLKGEVAYSPDRSMIAATYLVSALRPYERLSVFVNDSTMAETVLDEGSFTGGLSWHPDGTELVYGQTSRGENGSLVNDLYRVNAKNVQPSEPSESSLKTRVPAAWGAPQRLTFSRRAKNAVYSPDGSEIIYVVNEGGTGNLFRLHLSDNIETRITSYEGDAQIGRIAVHPASPVIAYARFDENGDRKLRIRNWEDAHFFELTRGELDDRDPVWSPDGSQLLYTSLRDDVPNLFVVKPFAASESTPSSTLADSVTLGGNATTTSTEERITALFTGATGLQWLAPDSLFPDGQLVIRTTDSKIDNQIFTIDATRRSKTTETVVPEAYVRWQTHAPPNVIPSAIPPDPSLILSRRPYQSLREISHVSTIPFPVYDEQIGAGVGLVSVFSEPLSKHMISGIGYLSFDDPTENSLLLLNYTNNQLLPSLNFSLYHNSFTSRLYEDEILVSTNSGFSLLGLLPRDWIDSPFAGTTVYTRLRLDYTDSSRFWDDEDLRVLSPLGNPESGWQTDLMTGFQLKKQKPYAFNLIHPLDGWGLDAKITLATNTLGGKTEYIRPDLKAFSILPFLGNSRFYLYGRAIAQNGRSFNQDYIGFSRYDEIQLGELIPGVDLFYRDTERVRGFRETVAGNRMLFTTAEFRVPLLPSLQTEILGLVSLGRTTASAFIDSGVVWRDDLVPGEDAISRTGAGFELKNVLNLFGIPILQSVGFAQPYDDVGTDRNQEIYYRVRASVAF